MRRAAASPSQLSSALSDGSSDAAIASVDTRSQKVLGSHGTKSRVATVLGEAGVRAAEASRQGAPPAFAELPDKDAASGVTRPIPRFVSMRKRRRGLTTSPALVTTCVS